ncbi:cytokine receptor common subunit gamma-like isoform X2 [Sinocyclocheilus grahami]|uniref:cytokine receptor common subunit gamma-like isoform X2 n=1 Tax=Sinocyclocheilus grahami TaxID=75366 RepID=UPI0007AD42E5|nr:PREDICTED: cytokine receptor common subunit gamma-like isoform X2 [Sinocyclocheilus grahami]
MTYVHTSRLYFGFLFLILSFQRCCSAVDLSVQCKIINLEYVECFWHPNTSTMNYTFSSAFNQNFSQDCPEYIMEHNYTVGCRIPLKDPGHKFRKFYTNVSTDGNHTISKTFESLQRKVQLNAPYNLSVMWNEQDSTLLLQWNSSSPTTKKCVIYMVRNQKDTSQSSNVTGTSYSLSQVSQNKPYVFQVRSTVADTCGDSDLWSDWSDPVEWGSTGNISRQGWWTWLYSIVSVLLLFLLGFLLCYCERKRIIFLPVVPDPSKNLQDLFHKHDGNVESWVHISRELKEAFQHDYTEPSCDVCELTPSCDAGPASQTDNCDEPSTEKEHADEPSTEKEHADEPSTEGERADEPSTEKEHADEPSTEGERADEPSTEGERADEPSTEGGRADEPSTEGERADEPSTEGERADEPSTEGERADKPSTGGERADEPSTEGERADKPSTGGERADEPSTGEERADKPSTGEEPADKPSTGEECADEPSTGEEPAGQQSS